MNSPSLGFLGNIVGGLDAFDAGAQAQGIAPPPPMAAAPVAPAAPADPFALGAANAGIAPMAFTPTYSPFSGSAPSVPGTVSMPGISPPQAAPAPPPPQQAVAPPPAPRGLPDAPPADQGGGAPMPNDVQFAPVTSSSPAREASLHGPKADAALEHSDFRNQLQASSEQAFYENQARQAEDQRAAAEKVAAQRAFQQEQLQLDYADSIQKLGQMKYDGDRWWSNKSTGEKIGSILLLAVGSLEALGNGGTNPVYEAVRQEIDADAKDQRLAWESGLEQAKGAQTAFSMMMQRYQNEDAAQAAIRAASLQAAEAKLGALHAQYGSVESANNTEQLRARLEADRQRTIAAGLKFVPATAGTQYKMFVRGQELPGLVGADKAQQYTLEHGVKPAEQVDQALVKGGIDSKLQGQRIEGEGQIAERKAAAEAKTKGAEHDVVLPDGETIRAPSPAEATTLRGLSVAVSNAKQDVARAKEIRSHSSWMLSPSANKELKQIETRLAIAFKDGAGLGALSGPDMDLVKNATADLTSIKPGVDHALDGFQSATTRALQNRVKTIPGAPVKSTGKMPGSFKPAGGK